jgi:hypothetical protein
MFSNPLIKQILWSIFVTVKTGSEFINDSRRVNMQVLVKIVLHSGSQSSLYLHSSEKINAAIPQDTEQEHNSLPEILANTVS